MSGSTTARVAPPAISRVWLAWLVAAAGIAVLTLFVAARSAAPNQGFAGAAEVLALISFVAVGIERIIELFWTVVGRLKHGWWPLNDIAEAVEQLVRDTNTVAQPAFDAALAGLEAARAAVDMTKEQIEALDAQIGRVRAQAREYEQQVERISRLGKDNQRVQLLATAAFQAVNRLDTAYGSTMPAVRQAFNDASQVTAGVSDILAGFKENPAKKVISIALGWALGLLIAGFVGLDLFAAAGAQLGGEASGQAPLFPFIGVALTGFVIGLGSNPTHEVIRFVTEAAKGRKAGNLGRPNVLAAPDAAEEEAPEPPRGAGTRRAGAGRSEHRVVELLPGSTGKAPSRVSPGSMNLR